jgi:probable addiction module antidote protein
MRKTGDHKEFLLEQLKDLNFALGYLNECLKDEDEGVFLLGLRHVAEAQGGIKKLALKSNLNREHLFRILSQQGNPRLETLRELAQAFGWRLALVPDPTQKARKAA